MNHDAPVTPAALQARVAELEQQLKLSDEGVSQLAQRCLELEQQLLTCQTELAKHSAEAENITVSTPEVNNEYRRLSQLQDTPEADIRRVLSPDTLAAALVAQKVQRFLLDNADITTVMDPEKE